MPYPFDDNALNNYLQELRQLKEREYLLSTELVRRRRNREGVQDTLVALGDVNEQISTLAEVASIPPRTFDVFLSDRDLKIKFFHEENPKPEPCVCRHPTSALRKQVQANQSQHVVTQCLTCGGILKHHTKASFPQWASLPEMDSSLSEAFYSQTNEWYAKRAALLEELPPVNDIPTFDHVSFKDSYLAMYPMPLQPLNCLHSTTKLTLRTYANGDSAVVNQCTDCGKHLNAVSKTTAPNFENLPRFDSDTATKAKAALKEWNSAFVDAMKIAMWQFNEVRAKKIALGEIKVMDTTTFGTYYNSPEWARTRIRIMERDDHRCQVEACGGNSECVHHITYDRLGCENDIDLIALCTSCHTLVHKIQDKSRIQNRLTASEIKNLAKITSQ